MVELCSVDARRVQVANAIARALLNVEGEVLDDWQLDSDLNISYLDQGQTDLGVVADAALAVIENTELSRPLSDQEPCPICDGQKLPSGSFCVAGCREGQVYWTSANVLRNVKQAWDLERQQLKAQLNDAS